MTLFPVGDQTAAAWAFVKWFTRPDISARWSAGTGIFRCAGARWRPVLKRLWESGRRKSALRLPVLCQVEPNAAGWQEVRDIVARALLSVLTGTNTAADAIKEVKPQADAALRRAAGAR